MFFVIHVSLGGHTWKRLAVDQFFEADHTAFVLHRMVVEITRGRQCPCATPHPVSPTTDSGDITGRTALKSNDR
jgi:hypothetical protein